MGSHTIRYSLYILVSGSPCDCHRRVHSYCRTSRVERFYLFESTKGLQVINKGSSFLLSRTCSRSRCPCICRTRAENPKFKSRCRPLARVKNKWRVRFLPRHDTDPAGAPFKNRWHAAVKDKSSSPFFCFSVGDDPSSLLDPIVTTQRYDRAFCFDHGGFFVVALLLCSERKTRWILCDPASLSSSTASASSTTTNRETKTDAELFVASLEPNYGFASHPPFCFSPLPCHRLYHRRHRSSRRISDFELTPKHSFRSFQPN